MANEKRKTANPRPRHASLQKFQNLKLQVNNLGKIKSAAIETSDLTLLLGKNNTGKSYIASLLWAAYDLRSIVDLIDKRPKWFTDFFQDMTENEQKKLIITKKHAEELAAIVNSTLKEKSSVWLSNIFSYEGFENSKIQFDVQIPAEILNLSKINFDQGAEKFMEVTIDDLRGRKSTFNIPLVMRERSQKLIFEHLIRATIFGNIAYPNAAYIPAARTGLMLAFPALVSETLKSLSIEKTNPDRTILSMATTQFLQQLAIGPNRQFLAIGPNRQFDEKMSQIARELERKILQGTIVTQRSQGLPRFLYQAEGSDVQYPLHVTSSMVTELAPFTLILKGHRPVRVIVFEEPEAHLHLAAQRVMARALAQLVNLGAKVIVTSHSDTFIQEINNLIQLHTSPESEKLMNELGYSKFDLVDPSKVKGYEFKEENSITSVSEIELTDQGLAVPTLTDEIISLAQVTMRIQQSSEPLE